MTTNRGPGWFRCHLYSNSVLLVCHGEWEAGCSETRGAGLEGITSERQPKPRRSDLSRGSAPLVVQRQMWLGLVGGLPQWTGAAFIDSHRLESVTGLANCRNCFRHVSTLCSTQIYFVLTNSAT